MKKYCNILIILTFMLIFQAFPAFAEPPYYPWNTTFEVTGGNLKGYAAIGIEETATDNYDSRYDVVAFSPVNPITDYLFPYLNLSNIYFLSRQINGPYTTSQWDMYIDTALPIGTTIDITWDSLPGNLNDLQLTLTDVQTSTIIDMQQEQTYTYTTTSGTQSRYFQIDLTVPDGNSDTDGDGMPDWWEDQYGLNLTDAADANLDKDIDGLTNLEEYQLGTDPTAIDTDGDGIPDGWERDNNLDPLDPSDALIDSDSDGVSNLEELQAGTDPFDPSDNIPVANAGADQTLDPTLLTLDGSSSYDPNNDQLVYTWSQDAANPTQISFISNGTSFGVIQEFILKGRGQYLFTLIVSDDKVNSLPDNTTVTINNISPTADAGVDQSVDSGTLVTLDGSASSDANEDSLTYEWQQTAGPTVTFSQQPVTFTPQDTGIYTFSLTVSDGILTGNPDTVDITVNSPNIVPIADAGPDQTVETGDLVTLDGTNSSDSDNGPEPLTYQWEQTAGPAVTLQPLTGDWQQVTFTPEQSGIYTFSLIVYDGKNNSAPDTINITVNNPNIVPIADAGSDQTVIAANTVQLGGGKSYDQDNSPSPLTYQWVQTGGTTVSLSDPTSMTPTFIPISPNILVFSLTVYDGKDYSLPDNVNITVNEINESLIANAGKDQKGIAGNTITLDGSKSKYKGSKDKDYELTYQWTQTGGSNLTLNGADTLNPSFTPLLAGTYKFSLTVGIERQVSLPDEVIITIEDENNSMPVADAGKDNRVVTIGTEVVLDGTGSYDPDGDPLTYLWRQMKGPINEQLNISESASSTASFTPSVKGKYEYELTVNDGSLDSLPDKIKIHVIKGKGIVLTVSAGKDNFLKLTNGDKSGITIFIPKGAVSQDTEIGISMGKDDLPSLPSGLTAVNDSIELVPGDMIFAHEIEITVIKIDSGYLMLDASKGIQSESSIQYLESSIQNPESITVYRYNQETRQWEYETDAHDNRDGTVSFTTTQFSQFVIVGGASEEAAAPAEDEIIIDGEGGGCFIRSVNDK